MLNSRCHNYDGPSSLKAEIVSFQMVIILRKLTTLKGFYRKTKIGYLNSWTPCIIFGWPYVHRFVYQ